MAREITGGEQDGGGAPASGASRWQKGQSGNPRGRPRGSRNKVTLRCLDLLEGKAEQVMERLISRAKKGDGVALRLCVERLIPLRAARDRAIEIDLTAAAGVGDLVDAAATVITEAAAGRVSLSEAREFMQLLDAQRKLLETQDVVVRLEALERSAAAEAAAAGVGVGRGRVVKAVPPSTDVEQLARIRRIVEDHHLEGGGGGEPWERG